MNANDEARMTNDEGMTKPEAQKPGSADDSFRNEDAGWVIREEPEKKCVYDLEEAERMNNETKVVREKTNERHLVHYSSFVIRSASSFGFRHSNHVCSHCWIHCNRHG